MSGLQTYILLESPAFLSSHSLWLFLAKVLYDSCLSFGVRALFTHLTKTWANYRLLSCKDSTQKNPSLITKLTEEY